MRLFISFSDPSFCFARFGVGYNWWANADATQQTTTIATIAIDHDGDMKSHRIWLCGDSCWLLLSR
jgi:hypothetical protein